MPVLVRWKSPEGDAVLVRANSAEQHPLLPLHLHIRGLVGVKDPDHPDLVVGDMIVLKEDIVYICVCSEAPRPAQVVDQQVTTPVDVEIVELTDDNDEDSKPVKTL